MDYQLTHPSPLPLMRVLERPRDEGVYMVSVIYGAPGLQTLYERFGFQTMRCGQMKMRPGREAPD